MIYYIPAPSAEALSEALFCLSRPVQIRRPDEITTSMCSWRIDTGGAKWIEIDDQASVYVHPEAILNGIADILQPYIDAGHLPADTNAQLAAYIEANRGGRITVYAAFPQFFKDQAKTYAQMVAAGLFQTPSMP